MYGDKGWGSDDQEWSWHFKGVSYSCSSPPSQHWGFPRYRELEAAFLQTVCPQCGNRVMAWIIPPEGKPPFLEDSKGQKERLWVRGTQTLLPSLSGSSDSGTPSGILPGGITMRAPPQRPNILPRRQQWDMGFSEHFPSVYHSSEVCDVRTLMDASIHRLDIMMYREPRDI